MGDDDQKSHEAPQVPQLHRPVQVHAAPPPVGPPLPMEPNLGRPASLHQYIGILVRRRWIVLACLVTVVALTALQVFTTTPMYRSTGTLQIDPEGDNVLPYQQVASTPQQFLRGEYLTTQSAKLKTRSLAQRVVRRLDMTDDERWDETVSRGVLVEGAAWVRGLLRRLAGGGSSGSDEVSEATRVDQLLAELAVSPVRSTRLVNVSFTCPDPALSATVVDAFAEEFIEQHLESKFEATSRATEFLQDQLEDLKLRVEESEAELLDYARSKNIVNYDERESLGRKRLADLSDELTTVQTELIELEARARAAELAQNGLPEILKTPALRDLEQRLSEAEQQMATLSGRFGPEWPEVKELRLTSDQLRQQIAREENRLRESAKAEYRVSADQRERLANTIAGQRGVVDRLNEDSIQYRILQREVETNKELYEGLLQRLKEAGVATGLRSSNIQIVDQATVPRFASSPQRARSLALALSIGLLLGIAGAFTTEALDNSLRNSDEVQELVGLPSLGMVPKIKSLGEPDRKLLLPARQNGPQEPLLAFSPTETTHERAAEAFRSLRTSILLSHADHPPKTLLVTSALPNEGKSTAAANIAIALSQAKSPTLLLDLDLRKPSLAALFGLREEDEGVSNYLSGNSDLIQIRRTRFDNLFVAPAGVPAPNPTELLGSSRLAAGLNVLSEKFKQLVIDTPPCLELSDALIVAPHVDGVIFIARAGKTPKGAVRRASEQIQRVGGRVLGVLMNEVDRATSSESFEYYQYGGPYPGPRTEAGGRPSSEPEV